MTIVVFTHCNEYDSYASAGNLRIHDMFDLNNAVRRLNGLLKIRLQFQVYCRKATDISFFIPDCSPLFNFPPHLPHLPHLTHLSLSLSGRRHRRGRLSAHHRQQHGSSRHHGHRALHLPRHDDHRVRSEVPQPRWPSGSCEEMSLCLCLC